MAKIYQDGKVGKDKISLIGVAQLLGSKSDIGSVCTSPRINMWSLHKPIHAYAYSSNGAKTQFGPLTAEQISNFHSGITLDQPNIGFSEYKKLVDDGDAEKRWQYRTHASEQMVGFIGRPYGTSESPYRLTDFAGYNHYAKPSFGLSSTEGFVVEVQETPTKVQFVLSCYVDDEEEEADADSISVGSLVPTGKEYYYTVRVFRGSEYIGEYRASAPCIKADGSVNRDNTAIGFNTTFANAGTYTVYHALATASGDSWISFPNKNKSTFEIRTTASAFVSTLGIAVSSSVSTWNSVKDLSYYNLADGVTINGNVSNFVMYAELIANRTTDVNMANVVLNLDFAKEIPCEYNYYGEGDNKVNTMNLHVEKGQKYQFYFVFQNPYAADNWGTPSMGNHELSIYDKTNVFSSYSQEQCYFNPTASTTSISGTKLTINN